jgi:glycosyltransferase involved in cell wall biosynthesis
MSPPSQSVALCTYNGSRFLREQLESIAAQTRIPDELVVCDDGSTDSTAQIVADFARQVPFPVHWHAHPTPMGSTKNFEKAISLCDGDVINLSDQDDVWLPDRLHATESAFQSDAAAGAFFSDAEIVDDSLNALGYRLWDIVRFGRAEQEDMRRGRAVPLLLRRNVVTGSTLAFRSEFRQLILPIPEGWVHDAWIAFLVGAAGKLVFASRPLIKYRQHSSNQIGALKRGFNVQLEEAGAPHAEAYLAAAANFAVARERLLSAGGMPIPPEVIRLLDAKIAHMNMRATMPRSRLRRLPVALRELAAGRYHCYSNAWKSFARDLWF